jgi:hypothetical protein
MKKNLLALIISLQPLLSDAQIHLGLTIKEIKALHPKNVFKEFNGKESKEISSFMTYGTFYYIFDDLNNSKSTACTQTISNINLLNAQVKDYNKRYIIVSDNEWKAYTENGKKIEITLEYQEKYKIYVFQYFDASNR